MSKLFVVGVFLFCLVGSYFIFSLIDSKNNTSIVDENFENVREEVESYGGAMIVSYDENTGEITGKRRPGEMRQAGVLSVTEKEYKEARYSIPKGSLVVPNKLSPAEAIEYGGSN